MNQGKHLFPDLYKYTSCQVSFVCYCKENQQKVYLTRGITLVPLTAVATTEIVCILPVDTGKNKQGPDIYYKRTRRLRVSICFDSLERIYAYNNVQIIMLLHLHFDKTLFFSLEYNNSLNG